MIIKFSDQYSVSLALKSQKRFLWLEGVYSAMKKKGGIDMIIAVIQAQQWAEILTG